MTWVTQLTKEYNDQARYLQRYRDSLIRPDEEEPHPDLKVVEEMIADLHYGIEWMRTGRQPNRRRGIDIHDAYSRSILMDMDLLPQETIERQELRVTEEQKKELVRILMKLSARERQCFLLHTAFGLSYGEIGKELKLSRTAVQKNVERARSKVGHAV